MNVEVLIIKSFQELGTIGSPQSNSRLIFPQYWTGGNPCSERVSEQEARFLFVKQLETDKNPQYYYSVEAPTKNKYDYE
jgi:hypothetical protein